MKKQQNTKTCGADINHSTFKNKIMHGTIDPSLIDTILNNPKVGAIATATLFTSANVLPFIDHGHINPLFMDVLQACAWCTTIFVGTLTIISWMKKIFWKEKK